MDLPQVKAAVKSWEKSFRAKHHREPTKEDIKIDQSGIAEQYALYRKLSKAVGSSSSQTQSRPGGSAGSTSAASALSSTAGPSWTPRTIPNSEYPTTPTPPSRRSSGLRNGSAASSEATLTAGPTRSPAPLSQGKEKTAMRKAANGDASSNSHQPAPSLSSFLTPRKPRIRSPPAYTGPIHDPHPHNPFLASPSRSSPFKPVTPSATAAGPSSASRPRPQSRAEHTSAPPPQSHTGTSSSPFIHASSPRKLRDVLEANSLRNVKARLGDSPLKPGDGGMGVTPRTRARKRLRGEAVDDTPGKPRAVKRRGAGKSSRAEEGAALPTEAGPPGSDKAKAIPAGGRRIESGHDVDPGGGREKSGDDAMALYTANDGSDGEGTEDDDELGPSPMKDKLGAGRSFTSLLGEAASPRRLPSSTAASGDARPKPSPKMHNRHKSGLASANARPARPRQHEEDSPFLVRSSRPANATVEANPVSKDDDEAGEAGEGLVENDHEGAATRDVSDSGNGVPSSPDQAERERLPTPPLDPDIEMAAASQTSAAPASVQRRRVLRVPNDLRHTVSVPRDEGEGKRRAPGKTFVGGSGLVDGNSDIDDEASLELVIVPTRRIAGRYRGSDAESVEGVDDDDADHVVPDGQADEEDDDVDMAHLAETETISTIEAAGASASSVSATHLPALSSSIGSQAFADVGAEAEAEAGIDMDKDKDALPPRLLSLLSLRSPTSAHARNAKSKSRHTDLVVRALFDRDAAAELKALRRGQEVVRVGEAGGGGGGGAGREGEGGREDEAVLEKYSMRLAEHGRGRWGGRAEEESVSEEVSSGGVEREDDDWESESEGWKRTGEDMDDW